VVKVLIGRHPRSVFKPVEIVVLLYKHDVLKSACDDGSELMKTVRLILKSVSKCGVLASYWIKNCSNILVSLGGIIL
jgi:hypothetical protein